jgi:hypothetical protein
MKVVINDFCHYSSNEFKRIMEIVKCCGELIKHNEINKFNEDFIIIKYTNYYYKFNRYDEQFIEKVKEAIETNPYKNYPGINYEGHLHIIDIDDRFTNKKYYTIDNSNKQQENIIIHNNLIIDDLYNKNYIYS